MDLTKSHNINERLKAITTQLHHMNVGRWYDEKEVIVQPISHQWNLSFVCGQVRTYPKLGRYTLDFKCYGKIFDKDLTIISRLFSFFHLLTINIVVGT